MTLADFLPADRAPALAPVVRIFRQAAALWDAWQARRARRLTLDALLSMPAYQLRDIGVSSHDVMRALDDPDCYLRK